MDRPAVYSLGHAGWPTCRLWHRYARSTHAHRLRKAAARAADGPSGPALDSGQPADRGPLSGPPAGGAGPPTPTAPENPPPGPLPARPVQPSIPDNPLTEAHFQALRRAAAARRPIRKAAGTARFSALT